MGRADNGRSGKRDEVAGHGGVDRERRYRPVAGGQCGRQKRMLGGDGRPDARGRKTNTGGIAGSPCSGAGVLVALSKKTSVKCARVSGVPDCPSGNASPGTEWNTAVPVIGSRPFLQVGASFARPEREEKGCFCLVFSMLWLQRRLRNSTFQPKNLLLPRRCPLKNFTCPDCRLEMPLDWSTCPHCARPSHFPNVRQAEGPEERQALESRYQQARHDAAQRGAETILQQLETAVQGSQAVITRPFEEVARLARSDKQLYATYTS